MRRSAGLALTLLVLGCGMVSVPAICTDGNCLCLPFTDCVAHCHAPECRIDCAETHSCEGTCGDACTATCAAAVGDCAFDCGDDCDVTCAELTPQCTAGDGFVCTDFAQCDARTGARADVSCYMVSGTCTLDVGPDSAVDCAATGRCEVTCRGACEVQCVATPCRVDCEDPASCHLTCAGGEAPTCPDGHTKACGLACP